MPGRGSTRKVVEKVEEVVDKVDEVVEKVEEPAAESRPVEAVPDKVVEKVEARSRQYPKSRRKS